MRGCGDAKRFVSFSFLLVLVLVLSSSSASFETSSKAS